MTPSYKEKEKKAENYVVVWRTDWIVSRQYIFNKTKQNKKTLMKQSYIQILNKNYNMHPINFILRKIIGI